jgi:glycosidase
VDAELNDKLDKGLDTLYNYPEFRRVLWALHGKAPAKHLEDSLHRSIEALDHRVINLVRFIDLHDTYRFLRDGEHPDYLKIAFTWLLFSLGIPLVYYGTEQAFRTSHQVLAPENGKLPADPENRQDMFPEGEFKTASSAGDTFDPTSPSFTFFKKLAELRQKHPALRRGYQFVRWSDPWGPGIYAFSRVAEGREVLVASNTAEQSRLATMYVDAEHSPAGTVFVDELDPTYTVTAYRPVEGGSQLTVEVPPRGVRVLVKKA